MTADSPSTYRAPAFADSKPELAAPGGTPERLEHLREHGFVIITDFVDNPWIPVLREAGRRITGACAPENAVGRRRTLPQRTRGSRDARNRRRRRCRPRPASTGGGTVRTANADGQ